MEESASESSKTVHRGSDGVEGRTTTSSEQREAERERLRQLYQELKNTIDKKTGIKIKAEVVSSQIKALQRKAAILGREDDTSHIESLQQRLHGLQQEVAAAELRNQQLLHDEERRIDAGIEGIKDLIKAEIGRKRPREASDQTHSEGSNSREVVPRR